MAISCTRLTLDQIRNEHLVDMVMVVFPQTAPTPIRRSGEPVRTVCSALITIVQPIIPQDDQASVLMALLVGPIVVPICIRIRLRQRKSLHTQTMIFQR